MQKLGRYNYTIEYKAGIDNVAADALSNRPDHNSMKAKFVHFSDQRGQPLVRSQEFLHDSPIRTAFNRTVVPKHHKIRTTPGTIITFQFDSNLVQVGIRKKDQEFLVWYVQQLKMPLKFGQLHVEMACLCIVNSGKNI